MQQGTTVQGHPCQVSARSSRGRRLKLAVVTAAAALGAAACSGDPAPEPPGAGAVTPTILTTTSIWADVVSNVACDGLAEVEAIIPVGSDPHGYEPSLQDTERMTNASLIVANGLTLEGRLEDTLEAVATSGTPVLEFAAEMDPIPYEFDTGHDEHDDDDDDEGHDTRKTKATTTTTTKATKVTRKTKAKTKATTTTTTKATKVHDDDHDDEGTKVTRKTKATTTTTTKATKVTRKTKATTDDDEGHEEDGHDDHGHDTRKTRPRRRRPRRAEDPHVWFDPHRVAEALPVLAQALTADAGLDPDAVEACLNSYVAELVAVDAEIAAKVEQLPAESRKLVTNHEALGYYAARYGFEIIGTVIPSPSSMAEPNPAGLERLAETIEHEGIKAIFAEVQHSGDDIKALAAQVGDVDVVTLYTGSLGPPGSGAETYTGYLLTNTDLIVDSLN